MRPLHCTAAEDSSRDIYDDLSGYMDPRRQRRKSNRL
jgi:hypothetical protein